MKFSRSNEVMEFAKIKNIKLKGGLEMKLLGRINFKAVIIWTVAFILLNFSFTQAKVIELNFATMSPGVDWNLKANEAWVNWLERESNGKIKIKYQLGLVAPGEEYNAVKGGLAEMGAQFSQFIGGQVDANEVLCLPWMVGWPGALQAGLAHMELYHKFATLQKELKEAKVLWIDYGGPTQIQTTKKPVHTIEDLKGLIQIEIGPYATDAMKLLGTTPVTFPPMENFDAMAKGVAQGISVCWDACNVFGYKDLIKYSTEVSVTQPGFFFNIINRNVFDKLPADVQALFDWDNCIKMAKVFGWARDMSDITGRDVMDKQMKKRGLPGVYVLPDSEKEKWKSMTKSVSDNWVKKVGGDASAILAEAEKVVQKYKWNDKLASECENLLKEWGADGK
jgi:TRAP-type C4-dicarboxylate transport system substrate-binding protein